MDWSSKSIVALLTVSAVVLAGCTGAISGDLDGEEIADKIEERHQTLDDVQGQQVVETTRDGETHRVTHAVWQQPPENDRREVIETDADHQSAGDIIIRNENEVVVYDSEKNEYTRSEFGTAGTNGIYNSETIDRLLESHDIERTGTETVADRDTHVLELTPKPDAEQADTANGMMANASMTLWVDTEYWYPLKQEVTNEFNDETIQVTTEFTEVAFNEGVDDDRFTFEPPEGAEETDVGNLEKDEFDDVEAAADATPFDLSEPTPPDGHELDSATVVELDNETRLTAHYDGEDMLTLSVAEDGVEFDDEDGEAIEIGEIEGTQYEHYGITQLVWECNGSVYTVSGSGEEAELLAFAESIGCE